MNLQSATDTTSGGALVPATPNASPLGPFGQAAPAQTMEQLHSALGGRWKWVITSGLVLGLCGAFVGWRNGKPQYKSEGMIRLSYASPALLPQGNDGQNTSMDAFAAFIQSQQQILASRRLLDMALKTTDWKVTGRGAGADVIRDFSEQMKIEGKASTEYLRISYIDADPNLAAAAVRAIISAYTQDYQNRDTNDQQQRLTALESKKIELQDRLEKLRVRIAALAQEVGTSNVAMLHQAAMQRMTKFQSALGDVQLALTMAKNQRANDVSDTQIAMLDPVMRGYVMDQERLETQLQQLRLRGYGEDHKQVIEVRSLIDAAKERAARYGDNYRLLRAAIGPTQSNPKDGGLPVTGLSLEALQADAAGVQRLYDEAKAEMSALSAKGVEMENLNSEAKKISDQLGEIDRRFQLLQMEMGVASRLSIISNGEAPVSPFKDQRMKLAGMGGLAGLLLPAGLLVGWSRLRPQYRYAHDATHGGQSGTLLGILPNLPANMNDPQKAADASQAVHQIRVMLQLSRPSSTHPVWLLTSAAPGEGKTSLTLALGLSFSASGCKTLLIDADLVGQKLSRGLEVDTTGGGLYQAMQHGRLNGSVMATSHANLSILSTGQADARHAFTLSQEAIVKVLADARKQYDVVLVDSGPILGSVEAAMLAPKVDGVIMTIARQQQRPMVERAKAYLQSIGAKIEGMVFNKAESTDFYRSGQGPSVRSFSANLAAPRTDAAAKQYQRFGSLVDSVASMLPATDTAPAGDKSADN